MRGRRLTLGLALLAVVAIAIPAGAAGRPGGARAHSTAGFWKQVGGRPAATHQGKKPQLRPDKFRSFTLDRAGMSSALSKAQHERKPGADAIVVSLPAPNGTFQRFELCPLARSWRRGSPRSIRTSRPIQRHRDRRPCLDDPRRPEPARLPCVRPLPAGRVVHRPVLPARPERLRRATTGATSPTRGGRSSSVTPTRPSSRSTRATTTRPTRSPSTAAASRPDADDHDHDLGSGGALRRPDADCAHRRRRLVRRVASPPTPTGISRRTSSRRATAPSSAVGELPGRPLRRSDVRSADRRRPPHVPARADHRPGLRGLLRRLGQRDGGEGHAHQPRRPGLRGRPLDPACS